MQKRQPFRLGGALLLLILLFGCSTVPPTAPPPPAGPPAEPVFVRVAEVAVDSAGQPIPVVPCEVTVKIDGDEGGVLDNGRFRLVVPAGAWEGQATITMTVPDPAVMECELTIDPPEANQFKVPVTLKGFCHGAVNTTTSDDMTFICKDEMTGQWKAVESSSAVAATGEVRAQLEHFSVYGVVGGKAGW